MTLSTSTVTLAPGSSRTYTLAPGEAVTVATEPNCYVTVTETPDVIATADQGGQTNVRTSILQYKGEWTYGPYALGGTVAVAVSLAKSTSSVAVTLGSAAAAVVGAAGAITPYSALAAADQIFSASNALRDYDDNAAFVETWADLNGWSDAVNTWQVSGGRLYTGTSKSSINGANKSFELAAGENMRAVFNFRMVLGGSSGGTMIGVSSDAAGATATAAAGTAFGIYFRSFSTTPQRVSNGSFADIAGAPALRAVDYTVTVTVDQMWISVVARSADGTDEIRTQRARSGFTVNNLFIFQSDSRELTGMSVGYVGARKQFATIAPRTSLEGVAYTTHWTGDGTNKFKLTLPLSYDSRVPQPVVILFHGNGSDENHFADNSNGKEAGNAFLAAGYATISAAAASLTTWGNAASTSAYVAAYRFFRDRYSLGPVLMYSNSMGAIESLNALADGRIPGVVGWATTHPAISLKSAYDDLFSVGFTALIKTAYGIAADGSDYASKTAGRDAMLLEPGLSFRGVPMWVLYATDDAAVDQSRNAIPFVAKIQAIGVDIEVQTTTGGHSAAIAAFMTSLTNFADDCIGR